MKVSLFMWGDRTLGSSFHSFFRAGTFVVLAVSLYGPLPAFAEWSYLESWKAYPEYKGPVPKKSDVIFSTRFKRDEAPEVARAYGATRIEWVYSADTEYIQKLRNVAPWFGGALSSTIPLPMDRGIAKDIEGNPIIAPFMRAWGAKWITVADKNSRQALYNLAESYLRAGAMSIQMDAPLIQFGARWWGADFSEASIKGFADFLREYPDQARLRSVGLNKPDLDYRRYLAETYGITDLATYLDRQKDLPSSKIWHEFQKVSVLSHYKEFRTKLDIFAGRRVPLSMNLTVVGLNAWADNFALVPFADYALVETQIDDLDILAIQSANYRALGMGFVPSILPQNTDENRSAISFLYALGAQPLVPWDVYINEGPDKKATRYFGKPEEYADLYRFVRANADVFDGFEGLPVVGILAPVERYDYEKTLMLVRRLNRAKVPFAMVPVRQVEGSPDTERLARLHILVYVNALKDFQAETLSAILQRGLKLVSADYLSDAKLSELSPLAAASEVSHSRVIFRAQTNMNKDYTVHVLAAERGNNTDANCRRSISLKTNHFPAKPAPIAVLRNAEGKTPLAVTVNQESLRMEIPCGAWNVIQLQYRD